MLKEHINIKTSYKCKFCGKKFQKSNSYNCHLKLHDKNKSYCSEFLNELISLNDFEFNKNDYEEAIFKQAFSKLQVEDKLNESDNISLSSSNASGEDLENYILKMYKLDYIKEFLMKYKSEKY